ncbi:MAG: cysteine--tRNA ligase [Bacteroidales bacterium]|nr:cysteine--tRNA ligase [Bacteroidales bacterium]
MENKLTIYNTLSRKKELFEPINPPFVGMYVCGPTVYGDSHLGHARPAITFDVLFRYLKYTGYKVRYVRNITDVGHLVNDADAGEDKIAKKAKLDQVEPMEIVQKYTNSYHKNMEQLNTLPPSIEPHASAHIIEQAEMVEEILKNGFAYEVNGSVYFDVAKYSETNNYGKLSGRILEDLQNNTRELAGQSDKKNSFDFALWKKAEPEHIMRWPSKWSDGFPGWHLECSVMSTKYLGNKFDIHGGGLDLQFPHHECEIAQSKAAKGEEAVKYWMHNNLITIAGQKMSKSLNNFIMLDEMFSGKHELLEQAYSPMVVKFFILQAHYRSTLDFSNKALQASEKGFNRLMTGIQTLNNLKESNESTVDVKSLTGKSFKALDDDLNTPVLIAHLFDGVKMINSIAAGNETINNNDLSSLQNFYDDIVFKILGLKDEEATCNNDEKLSDVIELLLKLRTEAKKNKDFATSDKIRNELKELGIIVKDTREGSEWKIN